MFARVPARLRRAVERLTGALIGEIHDVARASGRRPSARRAIGPIANRYNQWRVVPPPLETAPMVRSLLAVALAAAVAAQQPQGQAPTQAKTAQDTPKARPAAAVIPPTAADYHYGPHDRNTFDFWRAKSDAPAPL